MDGTKWVCVGTTENKDDIPQASNGYLTVTDSDGDQAYATWTGRKELKPGEISGAGLWTRGTGKWAAISGGMTYSGKAILGTTQGYVDVEGNEGMSAGAESAS
jgi:hypothetical protein